MTVETAKTLLRCSDGVATKDGTTYILVDRRTFADPFGDGRAVNGVDENATQVSAGYFPNNARDLCITAAAGTELAVASSWGTVNSGTCWVPPPLPP